MITTVAEMMDRFLAIEEAKLKEAGIRHAPTIGDMYEGLTREALSRALPPVEGDLSIVTGFAKDEGGRLSPQLDALLVVGKGERVPYTDAWVYPLDQILAVVEIKKNLYGQQVSEGSENLRSTWALRPSRASSRSVVEQCFQLVTRRPLPADPNDLSPYLRRYYDLLAVRAAAPVRILLGYHGFVNEVALRRCFLWHLASIVGTRRSGPGSLPDLILTRRVALVKNVAMPWVAPIQNGLWPLLSTRTHSSAASIFLEAIWTCLEHRGFADSSIFGEDLDVERWATLLWAEPWEAGWKFTTAPADLPGEDGPEQRPWSPVFVSEDAFTLANLLGQDEEVDLAQYRSNASFVGAANELEEAGIVGRVVGHEDRLRLLTKNCACVILPDGRFAVGENCSGRMERWVAVNIEALRSRTT